MASAYPPLTLEPNNYEVWHSTVLGNVTFEAAEQAARWIVAHDQRFPAPARFREVLATLRRANEPFHGETGQITEGSPADPETARRFLDACRRVVKKAP